MKTVGGHVFYTCYTLYYSFQKLKNLHNIQKLLDRQKSTSRNAYILLKSRVQFQTIE